MATGEKLRYRYYNLFHGSIQKNAEQALDLGEARLHPRLSDPNYLTYFFRKEILKNWIGKLPDAKLNILDVGGRIQPYRALFESKIESYVAIDPAFEGLVNIVARGEELPIRSDRFDIVICTQVLVYANNPYKLTREIYRVLKPGGSLVLTTPAFFPSYHDEMWRFLPNGLYNLLSSFSSVQILPEGHSVSGFMRISCIFFDLFAKNFLLHKLVSKLVFPLFNEIGMHFDKFSGDNNQMTTNYSCLAVK